MRRFPAPWTVEAIEGGFKVIDANGQAIAYVYGHADKRDAETAKSLTLDEARRMGQGAGGARHRPGGTSTRMVRHRAHYRAMNP